MLDKFTGLQKKHMSDEMEKWERGERNHSSRLQLNELMKKMKEQYDYQEENVI